MNKPKKVVTLIILSLTLFIGTMNYGIASNVANNNNTGFVKVEGDYALKADGSIWKVKLYSQEENQRIADGFIDLGSDENKTAYTALKADGTLWVWGENNCGQFAEVDLAKSEVPVKIMENVIAVSGLAALKKDGSVWIWGGSKFYTAASKANKPVLFYNGAKAISYGSNYIGIIDNKGVLYEVANNNSDSFNNIKNKKVKISEDVVFVNRYLFIKKDKTLWEISNEDLENANLRLILKNVKYADSDFSANCAIREDGTLWVWGFSTGNLPGIIKGFGSYPQKIMSDVKYASCSYQSVTAIKNDGSLYGFGEGCPKANYSIPRSVMKNVKEVFDNGWALTKDNTLWSFEFYIDKVNRKKIAEDVKTVTIDGVIEKNDGTKWRYVDANVNNYVLKQIDDEFSELNNCFKLKNDGSLWRSDLDNKTEKKNFEKFDDNINKNKIYLSNHLIYYIKNDNSLWISLNDIIDAYDPEVVNELSKPVKLMEDIKEVEACGPYIYAISNNGKLLVWRINVTEVSSISLNPEVIVDDVDTFDNMSIFPKGIIKKDKSHWSGLGIDEFVLPDSVKSNFAEVIAKGLYKDIDNMEDILMYNENLYIKKNGELWVKSVIDPQDNKDIQKFVKVMDNVKYAEAYNQYGIAICNDGSLWSFGEPNTINEQNNSTAEPKKLLEKVKAAHFDRVEKVFSAILEDNSFYAWGDNSIGQIGIDLTDTFVSTPYKLLDNVIASNLGGLSTSALKEDGTLMRWGHGYYIGHSPVYVYNPLNAGNFDKDTKIQHRNYASVGVNEEINLIAKITDPTYTKDVKVIISTGIELPMEKSSESYYIATIPGTDNTGVLSYHISASDSNGKTIVSDEYKVEIVKNDIVLYDSMYDEVVESDININIDGNVLVSDIKPVIKSGRTLIPVRSLCEALNAEVNWDDKLKTVLIVKEDKKISMKIGEKLILVNNDKKSIDVPAIIVNGRTMLPVRTVSEIIGATVNWDEKSNRVDVVSGKEIK